MTDNRLELALFGSPTIRIEGCDVSIPERKPIALLAYLAVTGTRHTRDSLATLLYPHHDQQRARANLRYALWHLCKTLGKEWFELERDHIALRSTPRTGIDVVRFQSLLDVPSPSTSTLETAVGLYQDDFLAGFTLSDSPEFDAWQFFHTETLRNQLLTCLGTLTRRYIDQQELDKAIAHARRWLATDPLHEPAHRLLMQVYAQHGQRAAALRQYDECVRILAQELDAQPDAATVNLYNKIKDNQLSATHGPDLRSGAGGVGRTFHQTDVRPEPLPARTHHLPAAFTPFIGRERELAHIAQSLAAKTCRLLTIVGPGGMGKSRLAVEAASAQVTEFRDGVYFVVLTTVLTPALLAPTILQALGKQSQGSDAPETQLLEILSDRQLLLILDNYEHLLPHSGLLLDIVSQAPDVKLLVTSRQRLNLREEWLLPLEGLVVPSADSHNGSKSPLHGANGHLENQSGAAPVSHLETYSAIRLFVDCVRRLQPDFVLDYASADHAVAICRQLEGMPLGIELATGWVRAMPLAAIARELMRDPVRLTTPLANLPDRHRSLQVVFSHSYALLTSAGRSALLQLAVFHGGFTADAAHEVAKIDFPTLLDLVDRSWLRLSPSGRYEMHEMVRQFAVDKLEHEYTQLALESPAAVRDRHAHYFGQLIRDYSDSQRAEEWPAIELELANYWAGWRWAAQCGNLALLEVFLNGVEFMQFGNLSFQQVAHACSDAVDLLRAQEIPQSAASEFNNVLAKVLSQRAAALSKTDRHDETQRLCHQALELLTEIDSYPRQLHTAIRIRLYLAYTYVSLGDYERADQIFHEVLRQSDRSAYKIGCGNSLHYLGMTALYRGEYDQAEKYWAQINLLFDTPPPAVLNNTLENISRVLCEKGDYLRAWQLRQELQSRMPEQPSHTVGLIKISSMLSTGDLHVAQGEAALAYPLYAQALRVGQSSGYGLVSIRACNGLGAVAIADGDLEQARRHFLASINLAQKAGRRREWAIALNGLGEVCYLQGALALAEETFYQALDILRTVPVHPIKLGILRNLAQLLVTRATPIQAVELLALVVKHRATMGTDRDRATRQLDELRATLPSDEVAEAIARGQSASLDDVLTRRLSQAEST